MVLVDVKKTIYSKRKRKLNLEIKLNKHNKNCLPWPHVTGFFSTAQRHRPNMLVTDGYHVDSAKT